MNEQLLVEIFQKRANVDFRECPELRSVPLMGKKIGMPPRELVYAFLDIEHIFNVNIPPEAIEKGQFDTFEHIRDIIKCVI